MMQTIDKTNFLYYLASSFASAEGWQDPNGRPRRNNNPGDLRNADPMYPKRDRALDGFVVFPSPEAGIASLYRQLLLDIARGWSIRKVVYTYAPPNDANDSENYLKETMRRMQIKPEDIDTPLYNFLGLEYIS